MGETKIEWANFTFNPWVGCQKVSPGCDHCYAEALMDKRYHKVEWGPHGERKRTSEANWRLPLRWAMNLGRPRVFCASLADWLDNQVPQQWRVDLALLIKATPELDWLLLTKRIENFRKLSPWGSSLPFPENVWLGVTTEDQEHYNQRWPILEQIPAPVRFISYEPALGPLRLCIFTDGRRLPDWVIMGGESGRHHRPLPEMWVRSLREECEQTGRPFFLKQMAGKRPIPADLARREFPSPRSSP
jgi:protein gp37